MSKKPLIRVWINGLLYKLYWELGVNGKMWLIVNNLYSELSGVVPYNGLYSRDQLFKAWLALTIG